MSRAKVLSTKITSTISNGTRTVFVGYVDKTDAWRQAYLSDSVLADFTRVSGAHIDQLKPETTMVALKEVPHQSKADMRTHYTGVEINADGQVIGVKHFPVVD